MAKINVYIVIRRLSELIKKEVVEEVSLILRVTSQSTIVVYTFRDSMGIRKALNIGPDFFSYKIRIINIREIRV